MALSSSATDLAHECGGRRIINEGAWAVGRNDLDALRLEHPMASLLHDHVAGEAAVYVHGRLSARDIAPVKDLLEALLDGRYTASAIAQRRAFAALVREVRETLRQIV
jgi:hypothetical protein